jgi:hypothetical protein
MSKKSKYLQKLLENCAIIILHRIAQKQLEMCETLGLGITWVDPKFSGLVPPSTQQLW